jgi:glucan phosphoethanolaminetransferase (alkaline phosphatase superfamily)
VAKRKLENSFFSSLQGEQKNELKERLFSNIRVWQPAAAAAAAAGVVVAAWPTRCWFADRWAFTLISFSAPVLIPLLLVIFVYSCNHSTFDAFYSVSWFV